MGRVLTISEQLYSQLESITQLRGLNSIEELLTQSVEIWQAADDDLQTRHEVVARIDVLRNRMLEKYGEQPDSTDLIRTDRGR